MPSSRVPCWALVRTSELSSRGERAERSSSAGSTPSRRTIALAEAFSPVISQRNAPANPACSQTTARAVRSGPAMARFFGTSSPNTMDSVVASTRASTVAVPAATAVGQPEGGQPGPEQLGDGRFGDVAGGQRGQGDPELAAGQLERQAAVRALHGVRAAVADLGDVRVDLAALQRGERELRGHRDGRAQGERGHREQAEHGQQHGHGVAVRRRGEAGGWCAGSDPAGYCNPARRGVRWARACSPRAGSPQCRGRPGRGRCGSARRPAPPPPRR